MMSRLIWWLFDSWRGIRDISTIQVYPEPGCGGGNLLFMQATSRGLSPGEEIVITYSPCTDEPDDDKRLLEMG